MATGTYRDWRIFRFIIGRKRLLSSTLAGLILLAALPGDLRLATTATTLPRSTTRATG
jgi:hypothetical protein